MKLRNHVGPLILALVLSLGAVACIDDDAGGGGGGGGSSTPTPTPTPPGGTGSNVVGLPGFCKVGDAATLIPDSSGKIRFALPPVGFQDVSDCTNADDRDTKNDEYTFVMFNKTSGNYNFQIDEPDDTDPPASSKLSAGPDAGLSFKQIVKKMVNKNGKDEATDQSYALWQSYKHSFQQQHKTLNDPAQLPYSFKQSGLNFKNGNAVGDEVEYRVPSDVDTLNVCSNTSGIVRVIGANAKIAVDRDLPYDGSDNSSDCSGGSGFLCKGALVRLANVIDSNIVPLLNKLAGGLSDIDGDGLVTIFITPRLNEIPFTDNDPNDLPGGVPNHGYTETNNLLPFDATSNPCSNEQEFIILHAPDPNGFFNPFDPVALDTYVATDIFGAVTFQLEKLISFNRHVFVNDSEPEEKWLSNALGMMFVDLAGFFTYSPTFMGDVSAYLDSPSYFSLTSTDRWYFDPSQGFQYLFGKFVVESQLDNTLTEDSGGYDTDLTVVKALYADRTGTDNLENNLTFDFDADVETEFEAMFKLASLAMVASGTTMQQAGSSFPYYKDQNTTLYGSAIADAGGSTRAGADGGALDDDGGQNPVGININGNNPILAAGSQIFNYLFENPDQFTYAPGNDFKGFTQGLALNFVRVGGLFENVSNFKINFSTDGAEGFVIRRDDIDPLHPIVHAESVHGTLDPTRETIGSSTVDYADSITGGNCPTLPCKTLTIVGAVDNPDFTAVFDATTGTFSLDPIPDMDFYNITIPAGGEHLVVWAESQVTEDAGTTPMQPMLAIASADDVPDLSALSGNVPDFRYVIDFVLPDLSTVDQEDLTDDPDADPNGNGLGCDTITDMSPVPITGFVNWAFGINKHLKEMFVLKPIPTDPDYDNTSSPVVFYQPRHKQTKERFCETTDPDAITDADDLIGVTETRTPSSFQEQILTYMARTNAVGAPLTNNGTEDTLAVDRDSEDTSTTGAESLRKDFSNNAGGYSVKTNENALLQVNEDIINVHITREIPVTDGIAGYQGTMGFNPPPTPVGEQSANLHLTAGQTYTIVVTGMNSTPGRYELKMRKYQSPTGRSTTFVAFP